MNVSFKNWNLFLPGVWVLEALSQPLLTIVGLVVTKFSVKWCENEYCTNLQGSEVLKDGVSYPAKHCHTLSCS